MGKINIGIEAIPLNEEDRERAKEIVKIADASLLDSLGNRSIEEVKEIGPTKEEKMEIVSK